MTTLTSRTLLLCALAAAARLAGAQGCKPLQWKGAGEERLLADRRQRVRDVPKSRTARFASVTDEASGELWKIAPRR